MNSKDYYRIRELAKEQAEIANSPEMEQLKKDWTALNDCENSRPMVVVETGTFAQEVIPPMMQCETEEGRSLEYTLLSNIVNHKYFGDDTFVNSFLPVTYDFDLLPFNLEVKTKHTDGVGHHFISQLSDLEEDFEKLQPSAIHLGDKQKTMERIQYLNELVGDILPAKLTGRSMYSVLTQNIVHLMDMEDMYLAMYDTPELFMEMMDRLSSDYCRLFDLLEQNSYLLPTTGSEGLGQGTYCFTTALPSDQISSTKQIWGFMDSQETAGISPQMFETFIFPYYKKVADRVGLLSYGCCEAVDPIWERCISKLENLRRVSISPWCNEEYMGEQLRGRNIVYHRKPDPTFLGVGSVLQEEEFRKHIRKTLTAARGCHLEFTQRDVYTINHDLDKVRRYVEIIRQEIASF